MLLSASRWRTLRTMRQVDWVQCIRLVFRVKDVGEEKNLCLRHEDGK